MSGATGESGVDGESGVAGDSGAAGESWATGERAGQLERERRSRRERRTQSAMLPDRRFVGEDVDAMRGGRKHVMSRHESTAVYTSVDVARTAVQREWSFGDRSGI